MLTRKGVCEQAEHVKSPQEMEYDVVMKTRTNLCRNIGALNGVSIRKNVSCGSVYNTETEKCTTLIEMYYSHSFHIWKSFIFIFSFHSERALHFCVAFSRVLRNYKNLHADPKRKLRYAMYYVSLTL